MTEARALVALSGGQDSTTCLYWAIAEFGRSNVSAISFDYGQRHAVELALAKRIAERAGVPHRILHVQAFSELAAASLTNPDVSNTPDEHAARNAYADRKGLPQSFVPGRNIVFLSLAAAHAVQHDIQYLVTGVCEADDAGYPDCRDAFINSLSNTIRIGMDEPTFQIVTPLMFRSKAETWQLADELGVLPIIVSDTNTCYEGDRDHSHRWGFGCGVCPACMTRREGYEHWQISLASQVG
jgi:7-cyano-7-deazaguanine synthase